MATDKFKKGTCFSYKDVNSNVVYGLVISSNTAVLVTMESRMGYKVWRANVPSEAKTQDFRKLPNEVRLVFSGAIAATNLKQTS